MSILTALRKSVSVFVASYMTALLILTGCMIVQSTYQRRSTYSNLFGNNAFSFTVTGIHTEEENAALQSMIDSFSPTVVAYYQPIANVVELQHNEPGKLSFPVVSGRLFDSSDMDSDEFLAVVGRVAAETSCLTVDGAMYYKYEGELYRVIGIVGHEKRSTQYDALVLLNMPHGIRGNGQYVLDFDAPKVSFLDVMSAFSQTFNSTPSASIQQTSMASFLPSALDIAFESNGPILLFTTACMALINVGQNSAQWVERRKRDIGVMKACGANTRHIVLIILREYIYITVIAFFFAFVTFYFLRQPISQWLDFDPDFLSYGVVLISLVICLFFGCLLSLPAILRTHKLPPKWVMR